MSIRLILGTAEAPQEVDVHVWLEKNDAAGSVSLMVKNRSGPSYCLAVLTNEGVLARQAGIPSNLGLKIDTGGAYKDVETRPGYGVIRVV